MFAVIKTGGKQYKVQPEDLITVERLDGDAGAQVLFDQVLAVGGDSDFEVGAPVIDGASVAGEIVEQGRGDKVIIFKKKRRQDYRRKKGHRQYLTTVRVTEILTGGAKPKPAAKKKAAPKADDAPKAEAKAAAPAEKAPAKKSAAKAEAKAEAGAPELFAKAPAEADDLTKLDGVGPKSAEALNELGVYTYKQMASWTPAQIDWVDERVKVKKLFERDGWIDALKELAK